MTRRFTGRHMLVLMLAFFGVVVAVNLLMATLATRTFGGTVVDNSYVASQRYNRWLDAGARAESAGLERRPRPRSGRAMSRPRSKPAGGRSTAPRSMPSPPTRSDGSPTDAPCSRALGDGRYPLDRGRCPTAAGSFASSVERGPDRARLIETLR